ncbi:hypothetical protein ACLOAV_007532 [Pseudogymnoascus australis]
MVEGEEGGRKCIFGGGRGRWEGDAGRMYCSASDATTQFPGLLRTVPYDGRQAGRKVKHPERARGAGAVFVPRCLFTRLARCSNLVSQPSTTAIPACTHQLSKLYQLLHRVQTTPPEAGAYTSVALLRDIATPESQPSSHLNAYPPVKLPPSPAVYLLSPDPVLSPPPLPAPSFTRTDTSRRRLRRIQSTTPAPPRQLSTVCVRVPQRGLFQTAIRAPGPDVRGKTRRTPRTNQRDGMEGRAVCSPPAPLLRAG